MGIKMPHAQGMKIQDSKVHCNPLIRGTAVGQNVGINTSANCDGGFVI